MKKAAVLASILIALAAAPVHATRIATIRLVLVIPEKTTVSDDGTVESNVKGARVCRDNRTTIISAP